MKIENEIENIKIIFLSLSYTRRGEYNMAFLLLSLISDDLHTHSFRTHFMKHNNNEVDNALCKITTIVSPSRIVGYARKHCITR